MAEWRCSCPRPGTDADADADADADNSADAATTGSPSSCSTVGSPHARPSRSQLLSLPAQERANLLFRNAEILAPMVRASTAPLRTLALSYGADVVYTEEIVDRAITCCDRMENAETGNIDYVKSITQFSPKVQRRMRARGEVPVVLRIVPDLEAGRLIYQMGTGEPDLALPAALKVCEDVDGIDVNMGCPKKFSVSGGMGSALLGDRPRACDIIRTLRRNLGELPVSAKIRLLKDNRSTVEFVRALVQAGANAVAIHGREVGDEAIMPAKWDRLTEVVRELKRTESVPIIFNGDLYTREDMENMRKISGADGVMMARPALYNVSIFRKPPPNSAAPRSGGNDAKGAADNDPAANYSYDSPLLEDKTAVVREYLRHAVRYGTNPKNTKYVLCEMMNHRRTPSILVHRMPMNFNGGQTIDAVCRCKSVVDLCKVWDVSLSGAMVMSHKSVDVDRWLAGGTAGEGAKEPATAAAVQGDDGRTYDDRYFLDLEGLRREREAKLGVDAAAKERKTGASVATGEEEKKDASADEGGRDGKKSGTDGGGEAGKEPDSCAKRLRLQ